MNPTIVGRFPVRRNSLWTQNKHAAFFFVIIDLSKAGNRFSSNNTILILSAGLRYAFSDRRDSSFRRENQCLISRAPDRQELVVQMGSTACGA
jgi:hypothetical protein